MGRPSMRRWPSPTGRWWEALGGLPAHKLHCSVLAEESIKSAIKNYYDRNGIEYDHSRFRMTAARWSPAAWCKGEIVYRSKSPSAVSDS